METVVDQIKTVVKARRESRNRTVQSVKTEKDTSLTQAPSITQTVPTMSFDDIFDIFAGMYVLKAVKRNQTIYMAICHELDHCWSAKDVALKASQVSERKIQSNELSQPIQIHHAWSKSNTYPQRQETCRRFLAGKCNFKKCGFFHDHQLKDYLQLHRDQKEQSESESEQSDLTEQFESENEQSDSSMDSPKRKRTPKSKNRNRPEANQVKVQHRLGSEQNPIMVDPASVQRNVRQFNFESNHVNVPPITHEIDSADHFKPDFPPGL